ncbi:MAG: nucleotidyltransferase family protein [Puniceicoccales bacterium]
MSERDWTSSFARMEATLLVLAAGMGSRYGGLKQIDPMGPNGETILDYSVRDAQAAGFTKVVFVIRRDFAGLFKEAVGDRYADQLTVEYAFQELEDLPDGFQVPADRVKPWGTAHAIRAARGVINEPFIAINADDYYGPDAYQQIAGHLKSIDPADGGAIAMVGYPVRNTLSPHGTVSRGVCQTADGLLKGVEEHTGITSGAHGKITGQNLVGETVGIDGDALVSMNFWAFTPAFFPLLEAHFTNFLRERGEAPKAECYSPSVVDELIQSGKARCPVLATSGEWFGVTYPEDKPLVQERLRQREA